MPREVVATSPNHLEMRNYEDRPLRANEILLRSRLTAEKHGTALAFYGGISPFQRKAYDAKSRLFVEKETNPFPMHVGNMTVGVVAAVGEKVTKIKIGERVYGYLPARETHLISEDRVEIAPAEMTDEELVCIDPATVALMAVREGNARIGDNVAVFGLGAIGLMAVQLAKLSGSMLVIGFEPIEKRRSLGKKHGADAVLDPRICDVGIETRRLANGEGVDIAIDTSGDYQALHQAIRATRYGGTVVPVSWYHGEPRGLDLAEEWHFNRQTLVSGARVESEPYREHPRWNRERIYQTVLQLFRRRQLSAQEMLDPIVKFDQVVEGYRMISEEPGRTIKLGISYD